MSVMDTRPENSVSGSVDSWLKDRSLYVGEYSAVRTKQMHAHGCDGGEAGESGGWHCPDAVAACRAVYQV